MTTNKHQLERLTGAAREAIDSLVNEYRERILDEAESRAIRVQGVQSEISVRDIIESAEQITGQRSRKKALRRELVIQIYGMMGATLTVIGVALMFKGKFPFPTDIQQQMALIITATGVLLAMSPLFLRRFLRLAEATRSEAVSSPVDSVAVFIRKWQSVEAALRDVLERRGHNVAREPISSIVSMLQTEGVLDIEDEMLMKRLLMLRNSIVHERSQVDSRTMEHAMEIADTLITKLKKRRL